MFSLGSHDTVPISGPKQNTPPLLGTVAFSKFDFPHAVPGFGVGG